MRKSFNKFNILLKSVAVFVLCLAFFMGGFLFLNHDFSTVATANDQYNFPGNGITDTWSSYLSGLDSSVKTPALKGADDQDLGLSEDFPIILENEIHFAYFIYNYGTNTFKDKYIEINKTLTEIDLCEGTNRVLSTDASITYVFSGVFNGNSVPIKNLYFKVSTTNNFFFKKVEGTVAKPAVIKNLNIQNINIQHNAATDFKGLAETVKYAEFTNINLGSEDINKVGHDTSKLSYIVTGNYAGSYTRNASLFATTVTSSTFKDCSNYIIFGQNSSNQTYTFKNAVGFVMNFNDSVMLNCTNYGNIYIYDNTSLSNSMRGVISGLIGYAKGNVTIDNCVNNGIISGQSYRTYVGGIIGIISERDTNTIDTFIIKNCINNANISIGFTIGGIVASDLGLAGELYILNCRNNGVIKRTKASADTTYYWSETINGKYLYYYGHVAGVISVINPGGFEKNVLIDGCVNNGGLSCDISGVVRSGICARIGSSGYNGEKIFNLDILNCLNTENGVRVEESVVTGLITGIAGNIYGYNINIMGCINEAEIVSTTSGGGLVGSLSGKDLVVKDCHNRGNIDIPSGSYHTFAGLIGGISRNSAVTSTGSLFIEGCSNFGNIYFAAGYGCSGLFDQINNDSSSGLSPIIVTNCTNYGNITSATNSSIGINVSGITLGLRYDYTGTTYFDYETSYLSNCINYGNITVIRSYNSSTSEEGIGIGGIVKRFHYVYNCINYGDITFGGSGGAGIVGSAFIVENCINYGKITASTNVMTGGIVCKFYAAAAGSAVINCVNYGDVRSYTDPVGTGSIGYSSDYVFVGGVVSYAISVGSAKNIVNCANYGSITRDNTGSVRGTGGIIGGIHSISNSGSLNIVNCYNAGDMIFNNGSSYVGGIIGSVMASTTAQYANATIIYIENCINNGSFYANAPGYSSYAGGILGYHKYISLYINNCINNGNLTNNPTAYSASVGGILGYLYGRGLAVDQTGFDENMARDISPIYSITNSINTGDLTAGTTVAPGAKVSYVGGLIACLNLSPYVMFVDVKDCISLGTITAVNPTAGVGVGGLFGRELYGTATSATNTSQVFATVERCYFLYGNVVSENRYNINAGLNSIGLIENLDKNTENAYTAGGKRRVYNGTENGNHWLNYPVATQPATVGAIKRNEGATPAPIGTDCNVFDYNTVVSSFVSNKDWATGTLNGRNIIYIPSMLKPDLILNFNGGLAKGKSELVITNEYLGNPAIGDTVGIPIISEELPVIRLKRFKEWNTMMDGSGTSFSFDGIVSIGLSLGSGTLTGGFKYSHCDTVLFAIYEYVDVVIDIAGPDGYYKDTNTVENTRATLHVNGGSATQSTVVSMEDLINGSASVLLAVADLASNEFLSGIGIKVSGSVFDTFISSNILSYRLNGVVLPDNFNMSIIIMNGKVYVPVEEEGVDGPVTTYIDLYISIEDFLKTYAYTVVSDGDFFLTFRVNIISGIKTNIVKVETNITRIGSVSINNDVVTYFDNSAIFPTLSDEQKLSYIYAYDCYLPVAIKLMPSRYYKVVNVVILQVLNNVPTSFTVEAADGVKYVDGSVVFNISLASGSEVTVSAGYAKQEYTVNIVTKSSTLRNISASGLFEGSQTPYAVLNEIFLIGVDPVNSINYTFRYWLISLAEGGTEILGSSIELYTSGDFLNTYLISTGEGYILEFTAIFNAKNTLTISGNWKSFAQVVEFNIGNTRLNTSEPILYKEHEESGYGYFNEYNEEVYGLDDGTFYVNEDSVVYVKISLKNYRKIVSVKSNGVIVSYSHVNDEFSYPCSINGNNINIEIMCENKVYSVLFKAFKENNKEVTTFNKKATMFSGANQVTILSLGSVITAINFTPPSGFRQVVAGDKDESNNQMPYFMYYTEDGAESFILNSGIDDDFLDKALINDSYIEIYVKLVQIFSFKCSANLTGKMTLSKSGILLIEDQTYYFDKGDQIILSIGNGKYYDYYISGLKLSDVIVDGSVTITIIRDEFITIDYYPVSVPLNITGSHADTENAKIGDVIVLSSIVKSTDEIKDWKINGKTIDELKNMGFDITYKDGFVSLKLTEAWFVAFDDTITSSVTTGFKPLWLAIIIGAPSIALLLLVILILSIISHNKKRKIIAEELNAKIAREAIFKAGDFIAGLRDDTTQVSVTEEAIKREMKNRKW